MDHWHDNKKGAVRLFDSNARPHPMTSCQWFSGLSKGISNVASNPLFSKSKSLWLRGFHAPKKAIGKQAYRIIDLLRKSIDRETADRNENGSIAAVQKLPERRDTRVQI